MGPKSNQVRAHLVLGIHGGQNSTRMGFYSRATIAAGEKIAAKVAVRKKSDSLLAGSRALRGVTANQTTTVYWTLVLRGTPDIWNGFHCLRGSESFGNQRKSLCVVGSSRRPPTFYRERVERARKTKRGAARP